MSFGTGHCGRAVQNKHTREKKKKKQKEEKEIQAVQRLPEHVFVRLPPITHHHSRLICSVLLPISFDLSSVTWMNHPLSKA